MDLFERFAGRRSVGKDLISGSVIKNYFISPFLVYCYKFVDTAEQDPEDPYIRAIMDFGKEHESAVYALRYPEAKTVAWESMTEGFKLCLAQMHQGAATILNLPLLDLPDKLVGVPDILQRVEGRSVFGDYHYIVEEIKSAKHFKHKYIMQAAFYNYLLGKIQGYTPEHFYLINRDNERHAFAYAEYRAQLLDALHDLRDILSKKVKPLPDVGDAMYPFKNYATKVAESLGDLSLINGIGRGKKEILIENGVCTIQDLAEVDVLRLAKVKHLGDGSLRKWRYSAQALLKKNHIVFGQISLPKAKVSLFFDFEGTDERTDELEKTDYLIGCLHGDTYHKFVAASPEQEPVMVKSFLHWLDRFDDYVLFHYGSYEKTALKRICEKYGLPLKKNVIDSMCDLLKVVQDHVAFPLYSNSLKDVAPYLGFHWRGTIAGQDSILLYRQYLDDGDKKKLQIIFDYNEDDCRATRVVKEFLEQQT